MTTHTIKVPCYNVVIEVTGAADDPSGRWTGGKIVSSQLTEDNDGSPCAAAYEAIERLILAHAVAGIDVASNAYVEGIETAVDVKTAEADIQRAASAKLMNVWSLYLTILRARLTLRYCELNSRRGDGLFLP